MAIPSILDRVQETTATTGTGTLTLAGALADFQSFATAYPAASTLVYYCAEDGANWEVGLGTYTLSGTTLSRTTVLASSNAGALVSFPGPTTRVFNTLPAAAMQFAIAVQMTAGQLPIADTNFVETARLLVTINGVQYYLPLAAIPNSAWDATTIVGTNGITVSAFVATAGATAAAGSVKTALKQNSGKRWFEIAQTLVPSAKILSARMGISLNATLSASESAAATCSYAANANAQYYTGGSVNTNDTSTGTMPTGHVWGVAVNLDLGQIRFYKDGVYNFKYFTFTPGVNYWPFAEFDDTGMSATLRTRVQDFTLTPRSGYNAWDATAYAQTQGWDYDNQDIANDRWSVSGTNNNLATSVSNAATASNIKGFPQSSGKRYFEIVTTGSGPHAGACVAGMVGAGLNFTSTQKNLTARTGGDVYADGTDTGTATGSTASAVMGFAVNFTAGTIILYKNGTALYSSYTFTAGTAFYPNICAQTNGDTGTLRTLAADLQYLPSGFVAWAS